MPEHRNESSAAYTCTSCGFATALCVCSDGPRDPETGRTPSAARNRLLAAFQLVTSPLVLLMFVIAEPEMIPEWPRYVGHCALCLVDGRRR